MVHGAPFDVVWIATANCWSRPLNDPLLAVVSTCAIRKIRMNVEQLSVQNYQSCPPNVCTCSRRLVASASIRRYYIRSATKRKKYITFKTRWKLVAYWNSEVTIIVKQEQLNSRCHTSGGKSRLNAYGLQFASPRQFAALVASKISPSKTIIN